MLVRLCCWAASPWRGCCRYVVGVAGVFHGDSAQTQALVDAIKSNCTCTDKPGGVCTAHLALLEQRFLDGLLFARWMYDRRLLAEEFALSEDHVGRKR